MASDDLEWSSIPVEPDTGLAFIEDVPIESPAEAAALLSDTQTVAQGLTVSEVNGRDDLWSSSARTHLTYCIEGFGGASSAVTAALAAATADWESAADVHFINSAQAACNSNNGAVVFNVRRVQGRPYLARSFFPSQARKTRELLIDATALPPPAPLTLTGVVRHELGHVLGLRHEHIRAPGNPCPEGGAYRAVTPYDIRSVMHYPQCDGVGGRDLTLTANDRKGIGLLYP